MKLRFYGALVVSLTIAAISSLTADESSFFKLARAVKLQDTSQIKGDLAENDRVHELLDLA